MTLRVHEPEPVTDQGKTLFVSASIPDPQRWQGDFAPLLITDAVSAFCRVFLSAGWHLVTAAHPTIAPLLLYIAAELPTGEELRVTTYQSRLFENILPAATRRFEDERIGRFEWTEAVTGDTADPERREASLRLMREKMFVETEPDAAIFVGGMQGVATEYELFGTVRPGISRYVIGAPGGEAARIEPSAHDRLSQRLRESLVFPSLARQVLQDLGSTAT